MGKKRKRRRNKNSWTEGSRAREGRKVKKLQVMRKWKFRREKM